MVIRHVRRGTMLPVDDPPPCDECARLTAENSRLRERAEYRRVALLAVITGIANEGYIGWAQRLMAQHEDNLAIRDGFDDDLTAIDEPAAQCEFCGMPACDCPVGLYRAFVEAFNAWNNHRHLTRGTPTRTELWFDMMKAHAAIDEAAPETES